MITSVVMYIRSLLNSDSKINSPILHFLMNVQFMCFGLITYLGELCSGVSVEYIKKTQFNFWETKTLFI